MIGPLFQTLIIQRLIELLNAIPGIPLWLTLSASLPREWSALQVYFGIKRGRLLIVAERVAALRNAGSPAQFGENRLTKNHVIDSAKW